VVLVVVLISSVATFRYQLEFQRQSMEKMMRGRGSEADLDQMLNDTVGRRLFGSGVALVGTVVLMLVASAVLAGVASVAGGKIGFRRTFAFFGYAYLIAAVGGLVKTPLILAKQSIDVRTSAAAFAPSVPLETPLGTFLNSLDVFSIWMLVALVTGYGCLSGFSVKKSAVIVIGLWAVTVAILVGLVSLRHLATGAA
jgi:hypothetical protein